MFVSMFLQLSKTEDNKTTLTFTVDFTIFVVECRRIKRFVTLDTVKTTSMPILRTKTLSFKSSTPFTVLYKQTKLQYGGYRLHLTQLTQL